MAMNDTAFCPEMLSALQRANSILLCTHIAPDGDAIGSTLAMGMALKTLGKQVTLCCADAVPGVYRFLPMADEFVNADQAGKGAYDAALAIDAADPGRLGDCADVFLRCPVTLQMDHHPTNSYYARINAVDGDASAAGCLVYRALRALSIPLTREMAQCLYCAISTDTGNFCFRNTTEEAFRIAAELMATGFPLDETARLVHLIREEKHVKLLGRALISLKTFAGGKGACMRVTREDYQAADAKPEHCDRIVNYALNLPGVEMAYLADGWNENKIKMSLRAVAPRNVAAIAQKFGGGGHTLAAGLKYDGTMEEACAAIEAEMTAQIEGKA